MADTGSGHGQLSHLSGPRSGCTDDAVSTTSLGGLLPCAQRTAIKSSLPGDKDAQRDAKESKP